MVRSKNAISTMMYSFVSMGIVGIQWCAIGYTLSFSGDSYGLIGNFDKIFLNGMIKETPDGVAFSLYQNVLSSPRSVPEYIFAMFQAKFAIISVALISGALAERLRFSSWCVFCVLWATLVYVPLAHWVWSSDGWLMRMGVLDFAGGLVVHVSSGVSAGAAMMVIGVGLLWFGWLGFNAGSAVVGLSNPDAAGGLASLAFATTTVCPSTAGMTWLIVQWLHTGKPSAVGFGSGVVAGLVVVTPAAGFVEPMEAMLMGVLAGVLCYVGVLMKTVFKYDDALDVLGVHALGGTVGTIWTGIFAHVNADGAAHDNGEQLYIQCLATVVAACYSFIMTLIISYGIHKTMGLRVDRDDEESGIDKTLYESTAYDATGTM